MISIKKKTINTIITDINILKVEIIQQKNNYRMKFLVLGLSILLLINCAIVFQIDDPDYINFKNEEMSDLTSYDPVSSTVYAYEEGPIVIDNNWSLTADTYDWCTGTGEWGDPYVIEDVFFNGSGSNHGLTINNTNDVFFEVKNCMSNASTASYKAGIYLENSSNGLIADNNCSLNNIGIYLYDDCDNNTITGNDASNNTGSTRAYGIYIVDYCDNNTISDNKASYNQANDYAYGIYLSETCAYNTLSGNNASYNQANIDGYGFYLSESCDYNTISGNNASSNTGDNDVFGIYLYDDCDNNIITENDASSNTGDINVFGICLGYSDNNTISGNNASNNVANGASGEGYGILLYNSYNNTVSDNEASNNVANGATGDVHGISLGSCDNSTISGNNASNNVANGASGEGYGIFLGSCDNNTISGNDASYNAMYGIYLSDNCDDNIIWMNFFSNNNFSQGYNSSDSASNWDNGEIGNYWGDFENRYPDAQSSNGIWWDWEYQINDSNDINDTLPMVSLGIPEIAASEDLNYMNGDTGNEISWTITDATILSASYTIYSDTNEIQVGKWISGEVISIDTDPLSVGDYTYIIEYSDGTAWGKGSSEIEISVGEIPKPVIITLGKTIIYNNITIRWSEISGVDSYNIYVDGVLNESTSLLEQKVMLWGNGTYIITVKAINGGEDSELSDSITIVVAIPSEETEDGFGPEDIALMAGIVGGISIAGIIGYIFLKKKGKIPLKE